MGLWPNEVWSTSIINYLSSISILDCHVINPCFIVWIKFTNVYVRLVYIVSMYGMENQIFSFLKQDKIKGYYYVYTVTL